PSMFDEPAEKERLEESKPEEREQITLREQIRLGPEKISLGTERISLGREKITLGEPEREKLSLTRENVRLTRDEIEEKLRLSPEEWDERVAEEEQLLLGDEKYQPPPTKTRQL